MCGWDVVLELLGVREGQCVVGMLCWNYWNGADHKYINFDATYLRVSSVWFMSLSISKSQYSDWQLGQTYKDLFRI